MNIMPDIPTEFDASDSQLAVAAKGRHWCLTALLWWLLIANAVAAVLSPLFLASLRRLMVPDFPEWVGWAIGALSGLNLVFVVALFQWKSWGFFGYAITALSVFALNVFAGLSVGRAAVGLIGTVILFGALQIGGRSKAWTKLE